MRSASVPRSSDASCSPMPGAATPASSKCHSRRGCRDGDLVHHRDRRPDLLQELPIRGRLVGLTTRRYRSGEIDYDGQTSRRGDSHLRGLLYEAATVLLVRSRSECDLRKWGLQLRERLGFKRAAVAFARKLAVIMHTMLITGEPFRETRATA